jgi:hypothetical protein
VSQASDVKETLKSIIRGYLDKAVGSRPIGKYLSIIDESADSKESFISAALRISRRIAMFIDKELGQTVYEGLIAAVDKIEAPQGIKRRYTRVDFFRKVRVKYAGEYHELESENISEAGMYIRAEDPFPAGSEVEMTLPLETGHSIHLTGVVRNYEGAASGETLRHRRGMVVEFKGVGDNESGILQDYIRVASAQIA